MLATCVEDREFKNIYISILVRYNVYINTCGVYMLYGKESADLPYLYWIPRVVYRVEKSKVLMEDT
jgi:hypothetical protein